MTLQGNAAKLQESLASFFANLQMAHNWNHIFTSKEA